ncbi:MAG TPA: hypothetical protein VGB34_08040 [Candidatus Limnocylindria bacterium]
MIAELETRRGPLYFGHGGSSGLRVERGRVGRLCGPFVAGQQRQLGERPPTRGAQQWETIGEQPDWAPGIEQHLPRQGVERPDLDGPPRRARAARAGWR